MDEDQVLAELEVWRDTMNAVSSQLDACGDVLSEARIESLLTPVAALMTNYSALVETHVTGTCEEWLEWWFMEYSQGMKASKLPAAVICGKNYKAKTLRQFAKLLIASRDAAKVH